MTGKFSSKRQGSSIKLALFCTLTLLLTQITNAGSLSDIINSFTGYSANNFLSVQGKNGGEDITCLGKTLPTNDFRVGQEQAIMPNGDLYYCCTPTQFYNPFLLTNINLDSNVFNPYIDSGTEVMYHKETINETLIGTDGKSFVNNYDVWVQGIKPVSINSFGGTSNFLACHEKKFITEKNKWGARMYLGGYWYDKDPIYNPSGTNIFHPNASVGISGQNASKIILSNQTLNLSANYTDYCFNNDCVANDSLTVAVRMDNSTGHPVFGNVQLFGNGLSVKGVFNNAVYISGNSSGILQVKLTITGSDANFTTGGLAGGFGGWVNDSQNDNQNNGWLAGNTANNAAAFYTRFNSNGGLVCSFENSSRNAGQPGTETVTGSVVRKNLKEWDFVYCQKNQTHACAYGMSQQDLVLTKTCNAVNTNSGLYSNTLVWNFSEQPGASENFSVDDFQKRDVFLNDANVSQIAYDGFHRITPNNFVANNSLCQWYIQNSSGTFLFNTTTLGFNITTCVMNSTYTNQFIAGNNISANFTPVNNFETGLSKNTSFNIFIFSLPSTITITQNTPASNTQLQYFLRPFNFSWGVTSTINSSVNCALLINGSQNLTFTGITSGTNFSTLINLSRGMNYSWQVNCTDTTPVLSDLRGFNVTNANPIFTQNMTNASFRVGDSFNRQVNCTDADNDAITFGNNQTQLFNISGTGLITHSPLSDQKATYNVVISCSDLFGGYSTSNFTYQINSTPTQLFFNNNVTNQTAYEISNQSFSINVTWNTTSNVLNSMIIYNSTRYNMNLVSTVQSNNSLVSNYNNGEYNDSIFLANLIVPLIIVNDSNVSYQFNMTLVNSINNNSFYFNDSQKLNLAYSIISASSIKNVTEGQLINLNFSLNKQTSGVNFTNATIEFDAINYTASIVQDSSINTNYTTNIQLGFYNQSSHFAQIFAYLNLSYAGVTTTRALVGSPGNLTISGIGVSNCSTGNLANATDNSLKFNIFDETSLASLPQATFLSTIIAYKTVNYQRNFSIISTNNGSFNACYRPVFDNLTASISAQYSNTSYGTRYYFNNLFNLINTTQTINLYLLQNATPGLTTITISVVDQDDQVLIGKTVEVWTYDFGTGQFTFLTSRDTNFEGKTQFDLNILNTYYKFVVKSGQNVLSDTDKTLITTTNFVIRISSASSVIMSNLISLFNVPKTINWTDSSYRNITFNYSDPNSVIKSTCMRLVNASNESQVYFNDCMTGASGRLTFDTLAKKGIYTAYINATLNSDGNTYNWDPFNLYNVDASILGKEGLMAAFFIVGVMFFAGLYNPAAAILLGLVGFVITSLLTFQALTWTSGGGIMFLIVMGIFLILRLKT